ncbi:Hypothetical protein R9X50_00535100 [Acrodontium crateriforme]|uniref:Zn(2)-C6 fungal-type domain-containing protein n=1 Tax=Acrodontium crateriforme TaxID=150365 RepID=A0AAQ3M5Y1_9PEZI|nr:Hypothetical protein R9X50_00535100 [Acrodontium crateriforme]
MMTAVMAAPQLAPRPSPVSLNAWKDPNPHPFMDGKENRPALTQLHQTSPAVRSRKERPCDGCRRRKSKCVLQESRRCVLCEFHKQECTFVEKALPRKRKVDESNVDEHARRRSSNTSLSQSRSDQSSSQPLPSLPAPRSAPMTPAPPIRKLFHVDESLSLQRHRHCKLLGQTTALDASLIGLGNFNDKNETAANLGTLRQVTDNEYFSIHADADVPVPDDEARALAEIESTVGRHGPALIDVYFRNVHPSYPIIQKPAFLDRHRSGDRQFNPPLLAAMYLCAIVWWEREPSLSSSPKPDVARLEYIAISSLTVAMQRPKISAVQAGLLLLQRSKASTWTLTVQLVALGQDIGLHLDCTDWSIPLWEIRLRKRLAWALYMQDKWSALMYGRPSHINPSDWAVQAPCESDFDEALPPLPTPTDDSTGAESAQDLTGRTTFMQMISLTAIMAEVCSTFYSQSSQQEVARAGRHATQLVLNRAKPVQLKLKNWFASLPAECRMDAYAPGVLSATGYLHLGYFATEISIHRRIVQSLDPATTDQYLLYICRAAAKTRLISAMDFANRLRPEHLDAFWYFASASNFALIGTFGALLQATAPGREEAAFYEARLREFKWTLGVSRRMAGWMLAAEEALNANAVMLQGLPEKPSVSDYASMGRGNPVGGTDTNGYTGTGAFMHLHNPVPTRAHRGSFQYGAVQNADIGFGMGSFGGFENGHGAPYSSSALLARGLGLSEEMDDEDDMDMDEDGEGDHWGFEG